MEALSLFTHWQSFRTFKFQELIQEGKTEASVTVDLLNPERARIVFGMDSSRRQVLIDGKLVGSKSKYPFLGGSVSFCPDDLYMIKGGPDLRRQFLNELGWSINPGFSKTLQNFERVLKQRNKLLKSIKDGSFSFEEYSIWTEKFIEAAIPVYEYRFELVKLLNQHLPSMYRQLFGTEREDVSVVYDHGLPTDQFIAEALLQKMNQLGIAERAVGYSLVGPHRDDLVLKIGDLDARSYASQGQIRGLVIALKVVQLELTKTHREWQPLLLLDDIISELDERRVESLMGHLAAYAGQLFLTTAEVSKIKAFQGQFAEMKVIDIGSRPSQNHITCAGNEASARVIL